MGDAAGGGGDYDDVRAANAAAIVAAIAAVYARSVGRGAGGGV